MSPFEIVVIVVAVVGIGFALSYFRVGRATGEFGRQGEAWMQRDEDTAVEQEHVADERQQAIPSRMDRPG